MYEKEYQFCHSIHTITKQILGENWWWNSWIHAPRFSGIRFSYFERSWLHFIWMRNINFIINFPIKLFHDLFYRWYTFLCWIRNQKFYLYMWSKSALFAIRKTWKVTTEKFFIGGASVWKVSISLPVWAHIIQELVRLIILINLNTWLMHIIFLIPWETFHIRNFDGT